MIQRQNGDENYELNRVHRDPDDFIRSSTSLDDDTPHAYLLDESRVTYSSHEPILKRLLSIIPFARSKSHSTRRPVKRQRSFLRPIFLRKVFIGILASAFGLALVAAILIPSYTRPPLHYAELRSRVRDTNEQGSANLNAEKIFIAASIFDRGGKLAKGKWGECILRLVDLLGPDNVHLSIYENDAGQEAENALMILKEQVHCDNTIVFEEHLSLDEVPHVTLPDGSDRVKRISYLSEARNRALLPLAISDVQFDKVLYINDVVFDPVDAAQLLFSTNAGESGRADYRAACAVDFINPVKFYDTFAARDLEGYGIGLPFFPWFTTAGNGQSRKDVLAGSDAVRVRSCWGGMVAFDARFFQPQTTSSHLLSTAAAEGPLNMTAPYRFRAEDDLYWDASECCLIHADIQSTNATQPGIYMNPYVRVAYDWQTLTWLGLTRRFEKLYNPVHWTLNKLVGMPWYNPRRDQHAWEEVQETVWIADDQSSSGGSFQVVSRRASHSGFCGRRALQVMKAKMTPGSKSWEFVPVPSQI